VLKVNCDGALRANEKDGAWGFVIRDSDGHGVLAGAGRSDALAAEGEACVSALEAAMDF
jgi:ribonuclease HI